MWLSDLGCTMDIGLSVDISKWFKWDCYIISVISMHWKTFQWGRRAAHKVTSKMSPKAIKKLVDIAYKKVQKVDETFGDFCQCRVVEEGNW